MPDEQASLQSVRVEPLGARSPKLLPMLILTLPVTPEKLCSPEFMKLLGPLYLRGELNRLVVDEVCPMLTPAPCFRFTVLGALYIRA